MAMSKERLEEIHAEYSRPNHSKRFSVKDAEIAEITRELLERRERDGQEPAPLVVKLPSLSVLIAAMDEYEKHADDCPEIGMLEAYKILLAEHGGSVSDE